MDRVCCLSFHQRSIRSMRRPSRRHIIFHVSTPSSAYRAGTITNSSHTSRRGSRPCWLYIDGQESISLETALIIERLVYKSSYGRASLAWPHRPLRSNRPSRAPFKTSYWNRSKKDYNILLSSSTESRPKESISNKRLEEISNIGRWERSKERSHIGLSRRHKRYCFWSCCCCCWWIATNGAMTSLISPYEYITYK